MPPGLARDLGCRFSREDLESAWTELLDLAGITLFGDDAAGLALPLDDAAVDPQVAGVKAMCLDVAHDCNLACAYCFASQGSFGGTPSLMTRETGRAAIDFLLAASKGRRYLDLDFFGGEPLLAFDVVRKVVAYAREQGEERGKEFRFTLTTNCTLLDEEKMDFLNEQRVSLILSVDGRPEVHDRMRRFRGGGPSHEVVMEKALRAVRSRGGRDYYVRGTYTRHNLDFDEDARYLYEMGFRRLSLEPAVGTGASGADDWGISEADLPRLKESYSKLAAFWAESMHKGDPFEFYHFNLGLAGGLCRERRMTGCGAGYEYVAVTPEGEVYPCHQLVGNREYLLGTIASGISGPEIQRAFFQARVPNKDKCRSCWARYLCGGGCHARAIASGGNLRQPDPMSCLIMKTRLEYALYAQILRGA